MLLSQSRRLRMVTLGQRDDGEGYSWIREA
jgi:hypothetical protein